MIQNTYYHCAIIKLCWLHYAKNQFVLEGPLFRACRARAQHRARNGASGCSPRTRVRPSDHALSTSKYVVTELGNRNMQFALKFLFCTPWRARHHVRTGSLPRSVRVGHLCETAPDANNVCHFNKMSPIPIWDINFLVISGSVAWLRKSHRLWFSFFF